MTEWLTSDDFVLICDADDLDFLVKLPYTVQRWNPDGDSPDDSPPDSPPDDSPDDSPPDSPPDDSPDDSPDDPPVEWPEAVRCRDAGIPRFDIKVGRAGDVWWIAPYCRTLPFSGAEWVDGDRSGYRAAYMFLRELAATQDNDFAGRVLFTRVPDAGYALIGDDGMAEGVYFYDTTPGNGRRELGDSPEPTLTYEIRDDVEDQRIVLAYIDKDGEVLEVRDYTKTVVPEHVRFTATYTDVPFVTRGLVSAPHMVYSRATVIAWLRLEDGRWAPAVAVYYDWLKGDGGKIEVRGLTDS